MPDVEHLRSLHLASLERAQHRERLLSLRRKHWISVDVRITKGVYLKVSEVGDRQVGDGVDIGRLRIAAKGLRYTVEYFREVLGPDAKTVIDGIKGLQDHLGDLQDAVVASNLLRDFLTWGTWGHAQGTAKDIALPTEPIVAPGVASYLAARQIELQNLLDTFSQVWNKFQSPEFGQLVAAALATL